MRIALLIFSYHDINSSTASGDTILLELLETLAHFKLLDKLLEDCRIVRVYGNDFEREETCKDNSFVQDTEHKKSTEDDDYIDDSNATEKLLQAEVDIAHEAIEVQMILQLIRENRLKSSGFSEYSLTRQLMKRAQLEVSKPCLIKYPNDDYTDDNKVTEQRNGTGKLLLAEVDTSHEAIETQVILQLTREDRLKSFGFSEYFLTRHLMKHARPPGGIEC